VAVAGRAIALVAFAVLTGASARLARAQPGAMTSDILRNGNTAATAGDWQRVAQLVDPLLQRPLVPADLAEAHRLAGIAAFFQQRSDDAERHVLAYLRIDLDGRLDPALYPPDAVAYFNDVASRHAAELRALRTKPKRSWLLNLIPPGGQLQNGERTKAYVIGGLLGTLLVVNLTTYALLRSWCDHTDGRSGGGLTCTDGGDHTRSAEKIRPYNIASGIGVVVTYAYGVYDGVQGYRQRSREQAIQPFAAISSGTESIFGIAGSF
jgi:hypothetical protein